MIDCKVYVAFHRGGKVLPKESIYSALHVGKEINKLELDMFNDSDGHQISSKNEIYSELTGWYWIWKNQKHDFVGTAHYRRYFTNIQLTFFRKTSKFLLYIIGLKKKRHGLLYVKDSNSWFVSDRLELTRDNFLGHFVFGLDARHVETVICQGRVLVEDRRMTSVDEGQILAFAREMGRKLWEKL